MMEIFEKGLDIHQATAAAIHEVSLDKVTKEMRYAAKEINFGILYGMGTHGLSWRAGISHAQAKTFIAKYFQEFSGVRKYLDETLKFTKEKGYCETLFGRRRYIPELTSTNFHNIYMYPNNVFYIVVLMIQMNMTHLPVLEFVRVHS
jgi:DNA polymerase-1